MYRSTKTSSNFCCQFRPLKLAQKLWNSKCLNASQVSLQNSLLHRRGYLLRHLLREERLSYRNVVNCNSRTFQATSNWIADRLTVNWPTRNVKIGQQQFNYPLTSSSGSISGSWWLGSSWRTHQTWICRQLAYYLSRPNKHWPWALLCMEGVCLSQQTQLVANALHTNQPANRKCWLF